MALEEEIQAARHEIQADGYDMSLGELLSLYAAEELVINPAFQRYFRWDISRKTRFIESLLLGIPVPPIFVFQTEQGIWELVDGLQRLSTVFEFTGELRDGDGNQMPPSTLEGTSQLPSLAGKAWKGEGEDSLTNSQRLEIKRARIRVEILKKGSSPLAKFELFQRLNTGGAALSEQEVRNCVMVMLKPEFHDWVSMLAARASFQTCVPLTEDARDKQADVELALRFVVFRNVPYQKGLDVHEYLDHATMELALEDDFDMEAEADIFARTFDLLEAHLGAEAFKRYDGSRFLGRFLMSAYETVAVGVAANIEEIEGLDHPGEFLEDRAKGLWNEDEFQNNSGAGVRGTTRLAALLPWAPEYFKP